MHINFHTIEQEKWLEFDFFFGRRTKLENKSSYVKRAENYLLVYPSYWAYFYWKIHFVIGTTVRKTGFVITEKFEKSLISSE